MELLQRPGTARKKNSIKPWRGLSGCGSRFFSGYLMSNWCHQEKIMLYFLVNKYNKEILMTTLTISQKGWVVIPAELRRKYQLTPGTKVRIVDYGGVLSIVKVFDDPVNQGAGMLKGSDSLTEAVTEEHRQERQREP
jgi:AbrB family looped-hinge helix DNA binding protein